MSIHITQSDLKIRNLPHTGKFSNLDFNRILHTLLIDIVKKSKYNIGDREWDIIYLLEFMSKQDKAVIKSMKHNTVRLDLEKRNCHRYTFGIDIVNKLKPIILNQIIKDASNFSFPLIDVKIGDHGDILFYYKKNDKKSVHFGNHHDGVPECPYPNPESWSYYTLLIGLDSTCDYWSGEGNTVVYLPHRDACIINHSKEIDKFTLMGKLMDTHSFPQSCMRANYLLFSSESLHCSTNMKYNKNKHSTHKCTLKIDLWMKFKFGHTFDRYYNYICTCNTCKNYDLIIYFKLLNQKLGFLSNIIYQIIDFLKIKPKCQCSKDYCRCECLCMSCITGENCTPNYSDFRTMEEERYGDEYYDDYDDCNGYC